MDQLFFSVSSKQIQQYSSYFLKWHISHVLNPGDTFPINITSGLTLQHCSSPVKMYYSKISTGSSKSVRKEGNMCFRNTISLPVLKSLCSFKQRARLSHVWELQEVHQCPHDPRGALALPELCCSQGCVGHLTYALLTCSFNSTLTLFHSISVAMAEGCEKLSSPLKTEGFS